MTDPNKARLVALAHAWEQEASALDSVVLRGKELDLPVSHVATAANITRAHSQVLFEALGQL